MHFHPKSRARLDLNLDQKAAWCWEFSLQIYICIVQDICLVVHFSQFSLLSLQIQLFRIIIYCILEYQNYYRFASDALGSKNCILNYGWVKRQEI